jgi:septal ring-binding cell division protein DamX
MPLSKHRILNLPPLVALLALGLATTAATAAAPEADWPSLEEAARTGSAAAAEELARRCYLGLGTTASPELAAFWWQRAAVAGRGGAAFNLGVLYWHGRGLPQDDRAATRWWLEASTRGHPGARAALGQARLQGRGIQADALLALADLEAAYAMGVVIDQAGLEALRRRLGQQVRPAPSDPTVETPASPDLPPQQSVTGKEPTGRPPRTDCDWLKSANRAAYTLQLGTGSSEARLREAMSGTTASDGVHICRVGSQWLALSGEFTSESAARQHIAKLPASLRARGPWPRPFAVLKPEADD